MDDTFINKKIEDVNNVEEPLVSILCFTYNQERYMVETIESFLMQKASFKFEVIIHDDASNDKTPNIIQDYASKFPEIIKPILQTENKYSQYGINFIFKDVASKAKGKYIALCGGDDYWVDPLKLQRQVDFLEKNEKYGMVHTKAAKYIEEKKEFGGFHGFDVRSFEELLNENTISVITVCIRRNLLMDYFNQVQPHKHETWTAEDYPTWLWIIQNSSIFFMEDVTAVYREKIGSISHIKDVQERLRFSEGIFSIVSYFMESSKGLNNKDQIVARHYSNMINMYFLTKDWTKIKKSARIFLDAKDWFNLFWIFISVPFLYSSFIIKASNRVRLSIFNLFNVYPIKT